MPSRFLCGAWDEPDSWGVPREGRSLLGQPKPSNNEVIMEPMFLWGRRAGGC